MNVFDRKLNGELHRYKAEHELSIKQVAEKCDIPLHRLYQFTAGNRPLNGEETKRLMDYIGINLQFVER